MPDLEALYDKYKDQGFVVLSISDEEAAKVSPFITVGRITYPVLLDPGRKVNEAFAVEGIPKSFVYDRRENWWRSPSTCERAASSSTCWLRPACSKFVQGGRFGPPRVPERSKAECPAR